MNQIFKTQLKQRRTQFTGKYVDQHESCRVAYSCLLLIVLRADGFGNDPGSFSAFMAMSCGDA